MRDRRLRKPDTLLNIAGAKARSHPGRFGPGLLVVLPVFKSLQNSAPGRIGNGMQRALERCFVRGHSALGIAWKSMDVNVRFGAPGRNFSRHPPAPGNFTRSLP